MANNKQILLVTFLLVLATSMVKGQILNCDSILSINIFAIKMKTEIATYSPSEKDIRNGIKGVFKKTITSKAKICHTFQDIKSFEECSNFKGLIYPKVILDINMKDGSQKKVVISSMQNISFEGKIYKQNEIFLKELLKLLPRKIKKGVEILKPIDSFCQQGKSCILLIEQVIQNPLGSLYEQTIKSIPIGGNSYKVDDSGSGAKFDIKGDEIKVKARASF